MLDDFGFRAVDRAEAAKTPRVHAVNIHKNLGRVRRIAKKYAASTSTAPTRQIGAAHDLANAVETANAPASPLASPYPLHPISDPDIAHNPLPFVIHDHKVTTPRLPKMQ